MTDGELALVQEWEQASKTLLSGLVYSILVGECASFSSFSSWISCTDFSYCPSDPRQDYPPQWRHQFAIDEESHQREGRQEDDSKQTQCFQAAAAAAKSVIS